MRRRSPPTALRLVQGPLPPRTQPRHTLPSIPRPAFLPLDSLPRGPTPPPRTRQTSPAHLLFSDLPPLNLELASICRPSSSGSSSPTSASSSPTSERIPGKRLRGPWDDSGSVGLVVDVDSILAMPKPVKVGV
ncbi:hypothetical protein HYDPIDRAFT_116897 [Hydnomerulius pinastri MD-312]|uniref:Uncharacterized protein n=1 Tax=Hydnomerulius pinastri MD-312 TaxID=994086 RepID=A0A0C9WAN2_9AGAM|nr:hypothetical protein HYDPIDRAFT_116897 [Hydnomerulius pinastri MD-312]